MVADGGATIQLIDYDGMYVDAIRSLGSDEVGHLNFQHPERKSANPFDATLDRFSLISLWLAFKALREDSSLWEQTQSEAEAILFRANDFLDPASSKAFKRLLGYRSLAADAGNFAAVCTAPLERIPSLADFAAGRNIPFTQIRIATSVPTYGPGNPYRGAYAVLSALDYEDCLRHVGEKVEVIGQIFEVKTGIAKNGKSYVFINFGDWLGQIFKISIWSEGLATLPASPDKSWVNKWISVTGLMEPPYRKPQYQYSHLSISVNSAGQMTVLSESDAQWRLGGPQETAATKEMRNKPPERVNAGSASATPPSGSRSSNREILARMGATTRPAQATPPPSPARSAVQPPRPTVPFMPASRPAIPPPAPSSQSIRPAPKRGGIVNKLLHRLFRWFE
jgi:hypothetical protein